MKKLLFFFFLTQTIVAQHNSVVDSLRHLINTSKEDTVIVMNMVHLSAQIANVDIDSAIKITNTALNLAIQKQLQKETATCYTQLGNLQSAQGDYFAALKLYEKALAIREKLGRQREIAVSYYTLGSIYVKMSDYKKGINYCYKSLEIIEKLKNEEMVINIKCVIADAYLRMNKLDDALPIFFQSLKLAEKNNNLIQSTRLLGNIGLVYQSKKDTANALKFFRSQLDMARKIGNKSIEGTCLANTGLIYIDSKDYKKALEYMLKSFEIKEALGNKHGMAVILANIASIYNALGNLSIAEKYCTDGLKLVNETGNLYTKKEILDVLGEIYKSQRKFDKALDCHTQVSIIKDSIMNEEIENEVTRKVLSYDFEKKALTDSLTLVQVKTIKDAELSAKESELKREQLLRYFLLLMFLFLGTVALLIVRQSKLKAKQQTIELEQKLLRSQMNPHFIFNCLQAIQNFTLKNNGKEATFYLSAFGSLTRSVLENSRTEMVSLKKEIVLLEHYLNLQRLLHGQKFTYSIDISQELEVEDTDIPPMLAQPFIENAVEHGFRDISEGGLIEISFSSQNQGLLLEIKDNGIGIKLDDTKTHQSLATTITKERIQLFNKRNKNKASFSITDAEPLNSRKGVKVLFVLPLS